LRGGSRKEKTLDDFTIMDAQAFVNTLEAYSANIFVPAIRKYTWLRTKKARSLPDPSAYADELFRHKETLEDLYYVKPIEEIKQGESLTPKEVKWLIDNTDDDPILQSAIVVHAYFGWRPREGVGFTIETRGKTIGIGFLYAKINWDDRYMKLFRAKYVSERYLVWHESITPYLKTWYKTVKEIIKTRKPEEWLTKKLKKFKVNGRVVTAKTFRKTVQTQFDKADIEDWVKKYILGHKGDISEEYRDWTKLIGVLREAMEERHYLLEVL
jgi:hypothetical protein